MQLAAARDTARALVAPGKGILAADESSGTIKKRFDPIGLASTETSRRDYREMLFRTEGAAAFISGVILYEETLGQRAADGTPLASVLSSQGILPGIKVDTGAKPLAGAPGELVTEGLDGLRERLAQYKDQGARFTKWRGVIDIGPGLPTARCIAVNAHALARYAALCQEAGLTPIVEPEVLMDGDHGIARCFEVTQATLEAVFAELAAQGVDLEGMLLKPNMVIPGKQCSKQEAPEVVAAETVRCFKRVVPAAVPGIVFLSGGQSSVEANQHLNAMNRLGGLPWELSFSYGRALQQEAITAWRGVAQNLPAGQRAYLHRSRCNSAARFGKYTVAMEAEAR
jgi:fructose-bisphosphate aldolase class I